MHHLTNEQRDSWGNLMTKKLGINNLYGASDFNYTLTDQGFLVIEDLNLGHCSVTNDIHNVFRTLINQGFNLYQYKVIYKDERQIYDGILINPDHSLLGIFQINAKTLKDALKIYDLRVENQILRNIPYLTLVKSSS